MNKEEVQEVLDELYEVRPEILNDDAKRLFDAIMSIADERDKYREKLEKIKEHIQLIQTYTDDERILAQCNLILSMIER